MAQLDAQPRVLEGNLIVAKSTRFALIATRFNDFLVSKLVDGALDAIVRHGGDPALVTITRVPGAWELPLVTARLADSGQFDAIVALGAVIRGSTPHFDYVAGEAAKGLAHVQLASRIPIGFGVLTTDTIEQAVERSGTKAGNKGFEAAMAAIEVVSLLSTFDGARTAPAESAGARTSPAKKQKAR